MHLRDPSRWILDLFDFELIKTCESCLWGKMTRTSFTGHCERVSDLLGLIHSDVGGPLSIQARGGYHYFIAFTDDFSIYEYVCLMKDKS